MTDAVEWKGKLETKNDNYFNIPSRDYSKEPASLGEKIATTAKMVAEPYARTISKAYKRLTND